MNLEYFDSPGEIMDFVMQEIVDYLQQDLPRMETYDREHYEDEDRQAVRDKISDIQQMDEAITGIQYEVNALVFNMRR